jgi:hypothetical protein
LPELIRLFSLIVGEKVFVIQIVLVPKFSGKHPDARAQFTLLFFIFFLAQIGAGLVDHLT